MLTTQKAKQVKNILLLILIAVVSFFIITRALPETNFIKNSIESVEDSSDTVMRFSAATLTTSLALSAFPDDFATPIANTFANMSNYFIAILVILFLEKLILLYGVNIAFSMVIPSACIIGCLSIVLKWDRLKSLAIRLAILGLSIALFIPCSTHIIDYVAADLSVYVEDTILETENGSDKLNDAMVEGADEKTIFEKLSDLFQTAINGISDLLLHFKNTIRMCMNAIAILFLTDCLIPLLNFFVLRWILKETFHIVISVPKIGSYRHKHADADLDAAEEELGVGE